MLAGKIIKIKNEPHVIHVVRKEFLEACKVGRIECIVARQKRLLQLLQFCSPIESLIVLLYLQLFRLHDLICGLRVHEEDSERDRETKCRKN